MRRLVLLLTGLAVFLVAPGAAYAAPAMQVSGFKSVPGNVSFSIAVPDLPAGTKLDDATVKVSALGEDLPTKVSTGSTPSAAPSSGPSSAQQRSVVVVFDASQSMADGNAIAAARSAATEYARAIPEDVALGLVTVANKPTTLVEPTVDRAAFTAALDQIAARGNTALYDGIQAAVALMPSGDRRIVVLSDGGDTVSKTSLAKTTARLAKDGIPVDVVGLGAKVDKSALTKLVKASAGRLIPANDTSALAEAFREAARSFTARLLVSATVPDSLAGRSGPMRIDVSLGDAKWSGTVQVRFAKAGALPALPTVQVPTLPGWLPWTIAGVVFVLIFVVVGSVSSQVLVGAPARRRITQFDRYVTGQPARAPSDVQGTMARTALQWSAQMVRAANKEERTVHKLDRAGMTVRPNEWLLLQICVVVTSVAVMWLLLPWWAGIPLGLLIGMAGTWGYRRIRTRLRTRRFEDGLPDALQLVIGSLRSGFSLGQALAAVVREATDPISTEFGRALAEARLGADLEDALDRVVSRTDSDDLSWAVMAIRIQREVGGNLAEVLQTAVDTMRERSQMRRHVQGLSAEGRLSAYILIALPIGMFLFMFAFRREYVSMLWTNLFGIVLLVAAGVLIAVGAFVMSRLVKVEV